MPFLVGGHVYNEFLQFLGVFVHVCGGKCWGYGCCGGGCCGG